MWCLIGSGGGLSQLSLLRSAIENPNLSENLKRALGQRSGRKAREGSEGAASVLTFWECVIKLLY